MKKILIVLLLAASAAYAQDPAEEVSSNGFEMPAFSPEQHEMLMLQQVLVDAQIKYFSVSDHLEVLDLVIKGFESQPEAAMNKLFNSVVSFMDQNLDAILLNVAEEFGQDVGEFSAKYKELVQQSLAMKIQEFFIVYTKSGLDKRGAKSRTPIRIKK